MYSNATVAKVNHALGALESPAAVQLYEYIAQAYRALCEAGGMDSPPVGCYFSHFEGYDNLVGNAEARLVALGFYDEFVAYAKGQLALAAALGVGNGALDLLDEVGHLFGAITAMDEEDLWEFVYGPSDEQESFESLKTFLLSLLELAEWFGDEAMMDMIAWLDDGVPVLM